ncbi:hypothetical protein [Protofrankia coriariae]|uniref:hypothetical protein n=1 Tax=Protofrankia coriariae TaxID=1562887 RepID=UPI000AF3215C|nr:hypothetical protein [Protofrankia coriariae]
MYAAPYVASEDREDALTAPPPTPPHPADCTGWLGEDNEGRARPCLTCRPWLRRRLRRGKRSPVRAQAP